MLTTWVGIGFIVAIVHIWADIETNNTQIRKMNRSKFCKYLLVKILTALLWPIGLYLLFFNNSKKGGK